MKKKDSKNYFDFITEKNPEIEYETGEDGIITVLIEWKGFYHKLAQRFFHRPRVSEIKLDNHCSNCKEQYIRKIFQNRMHHFRFSPFQ